MTITFDSKYNSFDEVLIVSDKCRFTKYNSLFRIQYYNLDMILERFQIEKKRGGSFVNLYDSAGLISGVVQLSEGGWIY